MKRFIPIALILAFICGAAVTAQNLAVDWPNVGYTPGGTKFSPLTQITPANVARLTKAWSYDLGAPGQYQPTPIAVSNVLYVPQGTRIIALKADTGTELWVFDLKTIPALVAPLKPGGFPQIPSTSSRGISYWGGTPETGPRLLIGTQNGFIVQLDAKTGKPAPGPAGVINLAIGFSEKFAEPGTSPTASLQMSPAIYKNLAIIAGRTGESGRYGPAGDPRAFDLLTGKEVWRFHIVPYAGEPNDGTWGPNGWQDRKSNGVWVPLSVDVENDIVYVPTGNANDTNFGSNRPGTNLYSTSLVALRASTGKYVWHFQFAHHDIYDWDTNSQPSLFETTINGQRVPGVAQMTKQGMLFMFNRLTGEPLFGVEERPVPMVDIPGDATWPTQPFPKKPVGLSRDSMSRKEVSKISPEAEKYCTELYDKAVNMGPHTPYGMVPSLNFPGTQGGGSWGGVSTNAALNLVIVNTRHLGVLAQSAFSSSGMFPTFAREKIPVTYYTDPRGYPCQQGPWSELVAVSTVTGDIVWRVPLGEYPELVAKGITNYGTVLNDGGPISTAGGLIFIGSTGDFGFRAFDARTGKELWKATLDNDVLMTPMTYQGANGKQYVIAVAGNGDALFHIPARPGRAANTTVYAFALP